ncbi:hypothetical protein [Phytohabitans aurantiacus]|uniref:YcxB-like protein domain-containing protein n=1 Tax=Phytohabitans aurantiacus TaxID=3016789 RepID=A0ABQ5QVJ2_9ACTN|nr:hypothetical protein [Phytohabitans aurantiacus]GLH98194.1 hypothetical protein Pa4123_34690 [Phytohabitans aurantiacus]
MTTETVFSFTAQFSRKLLVASLKPLLRAQLVGLRIIGVVLVTLGLLIRSVDGAPLVSLLAVVLGALCVLVIPSLTVRSVAGKIEELCCRPSEYRIDAQGVYVGNDLVETLYRWAALKSLDEMPRLLVARAVGSGMVAIPLVGLPDETVAQLVAYVREHIAGEPAGQASPSGS